MNFFWPGLAAMGMLVYHMVTLMKPAKKNCGYCLGCGVVGGCPNCFGAQLNAEDEKVYQDRLQEKLVASLRQADTGDVLADPLAVDRGAERSKKTARQVLSKMSRLRTRKR